MRKIVVIVALILFTSICLNCTQENGHQRIRLPCLVDRKLDEKPRLVDSILGLLVRCIQIQRTERVGLHESGFVNRRRG